MIHTIDEGQIEQVRELIELTEEHEIVVIERGEEEPSIVVVIDEKLLGIVSCISFLKDLGFLVYPTFAERINKGG